MTWNTANDTPWLACSHPSGLHLGVYGDSLTRFMQEQASWASQAYSRGVFWTLGARSGGLATEATDAAHYQQSYGSYGPACRVLAAGTNDCHPGNSTPQPDPDNPGLTLPAKSAVPQYTAAVDKFIEQGGIAGRRYLIVNIRRIDYLAAACGPYNAAIGSVVAARRALGYAVSIGNWAQMTIDNPSYLTGGRSGGLAADGVHPTVAGLNARADMILDFAQNIPNPYVS